MLRLLACLETEIGRLFRRSVVICAVLEACSDWIGKIEDCSDFTRWRPFGNELIMAEFFGLEASVTSVWLFSVRFLWMPRETTSSLNASEFERTI